MSGGFSSGDPEDGVSWAVPLVAFGLYGLFSYFRENPDIPVSLMRNAHARWSALEAVSVTICVYFGSQFVGTAIASVWPLLFGWNSERIFDWFEKAIFGQFWLIFCIETAALGMLGLFLRRRKATARSIGLYGKPQVRDLGLVVLGYLLYMAAYITLLQVVKSLLPSINLDQEQEIGFESAQGFQLSLVFMSLVVLPPIVEEIMMRGFLYTGLKNQLRSWLAVVGTSILFAIAHLQFGGDAPLLWVAAIDTFVLSLLLIYVREKSGGRLWAPIGLHALKNLVAFLTLFVFKLV